MQSLRKKSVFALALCLASGSVFAHPGHAGGGWLAGLLHPLTGIDHLLAMLAVGLWAGRSGGSARWQLPLAFLTAMNVGWLAGSAGWTLPWMESGIAASVLALGLILVLGAELPRALQLALTAVFALFHGCAHGTELAAVAPLATAAGFLFSTAALHGAGLGIAALLPRDRPALFRLAGAGMAAVGAALLLQ